MCGNQWNGIEVNSSSWNDLVRNTVCDNGQNGILLTGSDRNNLTGNVVFYNNTLNGINLTRFELEQRCTNNTVRDNQQ